MVHLDTFEAVRRAWSGDMGAFFTKRPDAPGFHDEALFDATAPPGHWAFSRWRFLLTLGALRSLPGEDVLDVAAGPCFMAAALHRDGRRVTVNDLRPLAEALDPWGLHPSIRRFASDVFRLDPAETGLFDVVLCAELIEHVAHPEDLLRHLRTFLRPRGHLVLTTPNGRFLGSRLPTFDEIGDFSALEARQFRPDADGHLFLFTPAELHRLLDASGYSQVFTRIFGTPAATGHLKARRLSFIRSPRFWYTLEVVLLRSPAVIRDRIASHILVCAQPRAA